MVVRDLVTVTVHERLLEYPTIKNYDWERCMAIRLCYEITGNSKDAKYNSMQAR